MVKSKFTDALEYGQSFVKHWDIQRSGAYFSSPTAAELRAWFICTFAVFQSLVFSASPPLRVENVKNFRTDEQ